MPPPTASPASPKSRRAPSRTSQNPSTTSSNPLTPRRRTAPPRPGPRNSAGVAWLFHAELAEDAEVWACPELVDTLDTEEDVTMAKKKRFTAEFKAQAVKLARESESTLSDVARDLGLPLSTLHQWVKKAEKREASTPEQGEVARLRRENEQLRMERDFLKKAAAFFAKHQQ